MTKNLLGAFNLVRYITVSLTYCFFIVASLAAPEHETRPSGIAAQQPPTSAKDMLSLANFYYSSNDTSDVAAKQYRLVIAKYPDSKEAEAAQYYLGSYYHRKYYIRKEKWQGEYKDSLKKAEWEYKRYISQYFRARSPQWLCDAAFDLSLDYVEQGNFASAMDQLKRIVLYYSQKDPSVYIYQVVWSENPEDVIDQSLNAKQLAEYAQSIAAVHQAGGTETIGLYLRQWCKDRKNHQSAK